MRTAIFQQRRPADPPEDAHKLVDPVGPENSGIGPPRGVHVRHGLDSLNTVNVIKVPSLREAIGVECTPFFGLSFEPLPGPTSWLPAPLRVALPFPVPATPSPVISIEMKKIPKKQNNKNVQCHPLRDNNNKSNKAKFFLLNSCLYVFVRACLQQQQQRQPQPQQLGYLHFCDEYVYVLSRIPSLRLCRFN